jgi:hypothetical protein
MTCPFTSQVGGWLGDAVLSPLGGVGDKGRWCASAGDGGEGKGSGLTEGVLGCIENAASE